MDHFSQRERENNKKKQQKKTLLINFLPTANADRARDPEMDFDWRGLLRNGESQSEV